MQPIDIKTLTLEQLKALAYDQYVLLNQTQVNLNILQTEIAERSKEPKLNDMEKQEAGE